MSGWADGEVACEDEFASDVWRRVGAELISLFGFSQKPMKSVRVFRLEMKLETQQKLLKTLNEEQPLA